MDLISEINGIVQQLSIGTEIAGVATLMNGSKKGLGQFWFQHVVGQRGECVYTQGSPLYSCHTWYFFMSMTLSRATE